MVCKRCKREEAVWHGYCLICFFAMPIGLPITPISSLRSDGGLSVSDCGDDISKKYKIKIEYNEE